MLMLSMEKPPEKLRQKTRAYQSASIGTKANLLMTERTKWLKKPVPMNLPLKRKKRSFPNMITRCSKKKLRWKKLKKEKPSQSMMMSLMTSRKIFTSLKEFIAGFYSRQAKEMLKKTFSLNRQLEDFTTQMARTVSMSKQMLCSIIITFG